MVPLSASLWEMVMCIHINTMGLNITSYSFGCLSVLKQLTHKCLFAPPHSFQKPRLPNPHRPCCYPAPQQQLRFYFKSTSSLLLLTRNLLNFCSCPEYWPKMMVSLLQFFLTQQTLKSNSHFLILFLIKISGKQSK